MCLPPPPHRAALNRAQVDRLVLLPAMVLGGHFGNGAKEWEAGAARPREEEILGFHSGLQSNPPPNSPITQATSPATCQSPAWCIFLPQLSMSCKTSLEGPAAAIKTPSGPGTLLAMRSLGSSGLFLLGETFFNRLWGGRRVDVDELVGGGHEFLAHQIRCSRWVGEIL